MSKGTEGRIPLEDLLVFVHAVLGAADARMYAVKTSGRRQVRGA